METETKVHSTVSTFYLDAECYFHISNANSKRLICKEARHDFDTIPEEQMKLMVSTAFY